MADRQKWVDDILKKGRSSNIDLSARTWNVSSTCTLGIGAVTSCSPASNACVTSCGFMTMVTVRNTPADRRPTRSLRSILLTTVTSLSRSRRLASIIELLAKCSINRKIKRKGGEQTKRGLARQRRSPGTILSWKTNFSDELWKKSGKHARARLNKIKEVLYLRLWWATVSKELKK